MKHKHAEMIKAKADNMKLLLLVKGNKGWSESALEFPTHQDSDYFLCHPKHANETIHWLNGGEVLVGYKHFDYQAYEGDESIVWRAGLWCMREDFESRIKPKKEKRWIVVDGAHITDGNYCSSAFSSLKRAKDKMMALNAIEKSMKLKLQIIEIEIEVE